MSDPGGRRSATSHSLKVSLGQRSYSIIIKKGLVDDIGRCLAEGGVAGHVGVVTDRAVAKLYAPRVIRSLKRAGFRPLTITLPMGERAKTLRWVSAILDQLVKARFERGATLLALGGGVVGDIAGFAASMYLRGISFVQVPTTLVAQVDSSVGGKTGVNHDLGKNLIGAFYQPRCVLIDPETLETLPRREWLAGFAEVIKYGMISDERFFTYLENNVEAILRMSSEPVVHIIKRSCQIKAEVVAEDEKESDRRRVLNYGHTVGHALESLGHYRSLIHGEAVAIGMVQEADLSYHMGYCQKEVVVRQRALIRRAGLPDSLPRVACTALWGAMQRDKKVQGGKVYCVLPERVGQVSIAPVAPLQFKEWFHSRRHKPN